jgi:hypothetical protein
MRAKKVKWLIYTVLVGLLPILCRLFAWLITSKNAMEPFAAGDFIAFGLVLHISNINEIEHLDVEPDWKTIQNGISILFIACYSMLFSVTLIGGAVVSPSSLLHSVQGLSLVSLVLSYSVYYHLERIEEGL